MRSRMARWAALRRRGGVTADSEATTLDLPLFLSEAAALLLHLLLHPLHCRRTSRPEEERWKAIKPKGLMLWGFLSYWLAFCFLSDYVECHRVWGFLNKSLMICVMPPKCQKECIWVAIFVDRWPSDIFGTIGMRHQINFWLETFIKIWGYRCLKSD